MRCEHLGVKILGRSRSVCAALKRGWHRAAKSLKHLAIQASSRGLNVTGAPKCVHPLRVFYSRARDGNAVSCEHPVVQALGRNLSGCVGLLAHRAPRHFFGGTRDGNTVYREHLKVQIAGRRLRGAEGFEHLLEKILGGGLFRMHGQHDLSFERRLGDVPR